MEISKEQVLDLYKVKSNFYVDEKLQEWFPEAFKVDLEVGKWYYHDKSKSIVNYQGGSTGYGFSALKNWSPLNYNISWSFKTLTHEWRLATTEERESALIEEAKKRGYKKGLLIQDIYNGNSAEDLVNVSSDLFDYESIKAGVNQGKMALRDSDGSIIFYDGVWAEIIKTFSKEEAEKLLGGKII
jgi:hypothetical protein